MSEDTERIGRDGVLVDTEFPSPPAATINQAIKGSLFGQDHAIDMATHPLENDIAGLYKDGDLANLLYCAGPTGVGKTLLAYLVAIKWMGDQKKSWMGERLNPLTKIDCPFYSTEHTLTNLIGSSRGYIGSDAPPILGQERIDRYHQEILFRHEADEALRLKESLRTGKGKPAARLTDKELNDCWSIVVASEDHSKKVILFDEAERAHPVLINALISLLDGHPVELLTSDDEPAFSDFTRAFVFMTSNINEEEFSRHAGFVVKDMRDLDPKRLDEHYRNITVNRLRKLFPAALVGRIADRITVFRLLDEAVSRDIVFLRLRELQQMFQDRYPKGFEGVQLDLTDAAAAFLLEKGFDRLQGARKLQQCFRREIQTRLSRALNWQTHAPGETKIEPGDKIVFDRVGDHLELLVER